MDAALPPTAPHHYEDHPMHTFRDADEREWIVSVDVASVKRCRDLLDVDLLDAQTTLQRLMVDPITLVDCLYITCKPQADERGISDEQFAAAMRGRVIAKAKDALIQEVVDFFPEEADRENLSIAIGKFNEMAGRTRDLIRAKLDSPELAQEIEAALSAVGSSFGSSPENSASTPAP